MRRIFACTLMTALLMLSARGGAADPDDPQLRFNRDIRPLLANTCFQCHGPDPGARKAKLRFDREEGFFGAREGGPTVVKGQPDKSPLYQRIVTKDPDDLMPPAKSHKVLKPEEKERIRKWIAQGAPWEPHWAFIKPERPALPVVKNAKWVRNPIDTFVLARLEAQGLSPAPEADRRALARRLSLDLLGLPPEPELVEAFLADTSADAYEKLVDKMLASPRYGEHRARFWMDAARYADTHGLHFDNFRDIWPYRDWIITAFNQNQPFDRFTVEQIAGDLLPNPTQEQIIATGFHRCNMTTNEGGTIAEENLANYARDRVETTYWVWLGLTANCAVCHDHKFDPITTKDFYSMAAFFRNTTQGALDGNVRDTAPVLMLPKAEDEKRHKELPGEIESTKQAVAARKKVLRADFDKWLETAKPADWDTEVAKIGEPSFHLPLNAEQPAEAIQALFQGKALDVKSKGPLHWVDSGRQGKALHMDGKSPVEIGTEVGAFEKDGARSYGCWVKLGKGFQGSAALFARMDDDDGYRGWDLCAQDGEFTSHLVHKWQNDAIKVGTTGKAWKPDTWQHVFVTYDGSGKAEGFKIFVDGKEAKLKIEVNTLKSTTKTLTPLLVGARKKSLALAGASLQDIRFYDRKLSPGEVRRMALEEKARVLIGKPPAERKPKEKDELFDVTADGDPEVAAANAKVSALEAEQKAIKDRSNVAHVMEEKKGSMPTANILFRGEYDKPRDKVEAGVPAALHPLPQDAPKSRLGLARWLVSPENALTPRVIVNRYWQEVFGTGIVKSSEDFGIMGDAPSHPELLDWLAVEFRETWDVKKFFRLMVTSSTYRQSAAATKDKVEKDPANRLFSRGPRFRMDAEMVRDYALAASGTLSAKIGGPSVKPYQPDGVWDAVGMRESNTKTYKRDNGEALYRRSLYWFWKRMAPPASLEILNAPSREVSCLRRERTNTPLQALVTLNDPQMIEAARALATLALKGGNDDAARLRVAATRVLARPLTEKEAAVVMRIKGQLSDHYKAKPEDAKALVGVGELKPDPALDPAELAAWTMICNQLLNLDETLNK
ncbi:MAG TPA: DUF1553 domain-containing protein [Planctomycetota bacterium]|jgi:hypothetical protein|nr:DUF1553 domain-containing protein [Planctomycetota bacterium]